ARRPEAPAHPDGRRAGGRDRGQGALRRRVHPDRGPRRRHPVSGTDSAGQPWAGRAFTTSPWSGDDGTAPAGYTAALVAFHAGETGPEAVVDALRGVRLLVPLLADVGETGETA